MNDWKIDYKTDFISISSKIFLFVFASMTAEK